MTVVLASYLITKGALRSRASMLEPESMMAAVQRLEESLEARPSDPVARVTLGRLWSERGLHTVICSVPSQLRETLAQCSPAAVADCLGALLRRRLGPT